MSSLDTNISQLSDSSAIAILARFPEVRQASSATTTPSREQRQALAEHFNVVPDSGAVADGELARQTLLLLADDPEKREIIQTMLENLPASRPRFDAGVSIAVGTAALVILQTYVHVKRDKDGKWTFELKKQPTDKAILKLFLEKLLAYLPGK